MIVFCLNLWLQTKTKHITRAANRHTQKDIIYAHVNETVFLCVCAWARPVRLSAVVHNSHSLTLHLFSWNHIQNHLIYDHMHSAFDRCLNAVVSSSSLLFSVLLLLLSLVATTPDSFIRISLCFRARCCSSRRKITVHFSIFPCFA